WYASLNALGVVQLIWIWCMPGLSVPASYTQLARPRSMYPAMVGLVGIVAGVFGDDFRVSELIDCPVPDELARLKLGAPLPVPAFVPSVESAALPGMNGRYVIFDLRGANCSSCSSGLIASRSG